MILRELDLKSIAADVSATPSEPEAGAGSEWLMFVKCLQAL